MARPRKHYGRWRIRWSDAVGRRRSETYATKQEAELALKAHEFDVLKARAGHSIVPSGDRTFDELADYWIRYRVPEKRSGAHDVSVIRRHLKPFFGSTLLRNITVGHVDAFRERFPSGPKTMFNVLTLLIAMLNYAVTLGWLASVPRIAKPKLGQTDYRFLRTVEEIHRLLAAAKRKGVEVHAVYATAVYTGMRAGELAGLLWDAVDLDRRLITVQRSYDGPTKAGYVRRVPVLDPLLPVLLEWRPFRCSDLVFPNRSGAMHQPSARVFQEVLHGVLRDAGFPPRHVRFHDLRHTFASHWVMNGGSLYKLQQICGWRSHSMVRRYAHLAPEAFADDYKRLGEAPSDARVVRIVGT